MTNFERFIYGFERLCMATKAWVSLLTKEETDDINHKMFFFLYLQPYSWDK
jgi:hypothetical protein